MSNFDTDQTISIPLDDIRRGVTITNVRTFFNEEALRDFADTLYRDGLMSPLVVMETEDPDSGDEITELVAGERRYKAIQWVQENVDEDFYADGVPCILYVGTTEDAEFANVLENIEREEVDDIDLAAWIFSRTEDGISQTDLADKLHKPLQWVNFRHLFHVRACQELKDLLREGLISFTAAYELSKEVEEDEQKKWVKKARKFNERISIQQAQNANNPNKTARPSKKQRDLMRAKAEGISEKENKKIAQGAGLALRWVDGLLSDDEMDEALRLDESEEL